MLCACVGILREKASTYLGRTHLIVRCVRLLVQRQEGDALDAVRTRLLEHYFVVCFLSRNHGREFRRGNDGSEALWGGSERESTRKNSQAPKKTTRRHALKSPSSRDVFSSVTTLAPWEQTAAAEKVVRKGGWILALPASPRTGGALASGDQPPKIPKTTISRC